jgi:hypothetical protein
LQEAGDWSSLEMPRRYHKRQQIANQGLRAPSEHEELGDIFVVILSSCHQAQRVALPYHLSYASIATCSTSPVVRSR